MRLSHQLTLAAAACAVVSTAPAGAATRCKPVGSGSVGAPGNLVAANTGCTTAQRVSRACLVDDTCTVVSTRRTLRVRGRSWRCSTSLLPKERGSRTSCLSGPRVVRFDLLSFD